MYNIITIIVYMTNTEPRRAQCAAEPERYKHSTIYKIVSVEQKSLKIYIY